MQHHAGRSRRRHVALLIETSNAYARGLLQGVVHFIKEHGAWTFHLMEQGRGDAPPKWLERWDGDGIIARIETPRIARAVLRCRVPAVDVSAARLVPSLPWVETDDAAIAKLAITLLTERGFKNLAFCGDPHFNWSLWRQQHFCSVALPRFSRKPPPSSTPAAVRGSCWARCSNEPDWSERFSLTAARLSATTASPFGERLNRSR